MGGTNVNELLPDAAQPLGHRAHHRRLQRRLRRRRSRPATATARWARDTRGCIRIPASLCGITGLKPTYGRVSMRGVIPLNWSLDHAGPMARSADDCALILNAIAGYDPHDPTSADLPVAGLRGVARAAAPRRRAHRRAAQLLLRRGGSSSRRCSRRAGAPRRLRFAGRRGAATSTSRGPLEFAAEQRLRRRGGVVPRDSVAASTRRSTASRSTDAHRASSRRSRASPTCAPLAANSRCSRRVRELYARRRPDPDADVARSWRRRSPRSTPTMAPGGNAAGAQHQPVQHRRHPDDLVPAASHRGPADRRFSWRGAGGRRGWCCARRTPTSRSRTGTCAGRRSKGQLNSGKPVLSVRQVQTRGQQFIEGGY